MVDDELLQFGQCIRNLRKQKGWSQENLAERAGLHRTYIGAIERGEQNVSLKNILKLATVFDLSPSELFDNWTTFDE
jgi:transcriptional regulator with XRE-family HTH domain